MVNKKASKAKNGEDEAKWVQLKPLQETLRDPNTAPKVFLQVLQDVLQLIDDNASLPRGTVLSKLVEDLCECTQNRNARIACASLDFFRSIVGVYSAQFSCEIPNVLPVCVQALGRGGSIRTASNKLLVAFANVDNYDPKAVLEAVAEESSGAGEGKLRAECCVALQSVYNQTKFASVELQAEALQEIVIHALIIAITDESAEVRVVAARALDAVRWNEQDEFEAIIAALPPSDQQMVRKRLGQKEEAAVAPDRAAQAAAVAASLSDTHRSHISFRKSAGLADMRNGKSAQGATTTDDDGDCDDSPDASLGVSFNRTASSKVLEVMRRRRAAADEETDMDEKPMLHRNAGAMPTADDDDDDDDDDDALADDEEPSVEPSSDGSFMTPAPPLPAPLLPAGERRRAEEGDRQRDGERRKKREKDKKKKRRKLPGVPASETEEWVIRGGGLPQLRSAVPAAGPSHGGAPGPLPGGGVDLSASSAVDSADPSPSGTLKKSLHVQFEGQKGEDGDRDALAAPGKGKKKLKMRQSKEGAEGRARRPGRAEGPESELEKSKRKGKRGGAGEGWFPDEREKPGAIHVRWELNDAEEGAKVRGRGREVQDAGRKGRRGRSEESRPAAGAQRGGGRDRSRSRDPSRDPSRGRRDESPQRRGGRGVKEAGGGPGARGGRAVGLAPLEKPERASSLPSSLNNSLKSLPKGKAGRNAPSGVTAAAKPSLSPRREPRGTKAPSDSSSTDRAPVNMKSAPLAPPMAPAEPASGPGVALKKKAKKGGAVRA